MNMKNLNYFEKKKPSQFNFQYNHGLETSPGFFFKSNYH